MPKAPSRKMESRVARFCASRRVKQGRERREHVFAHGALSGLNWGGKDDTHETERRHDGTSRRGADPYAPGARAGGREVDAGRHHRPPGPSLSLLLLRPRPRFLSKARHRHDAKRGVELRQRPAGHPGRERGPDLGGRSDRPAGRYLRRKAARGQQLYAAARLHAARAPGDRGNQGPWRQALRRRLRRRRDPVDPAPDDPAGRR